MSDQSITFDGAVGYYDQTRGFPPGEEQGVAALFVQAGRLGRTSCVLEIGWGPGASRCRWRRMSGIMSAWISRAR